MDLRCGEMPGQQLLLIKRDQELHRLSPIGMRQDRSRYRHEQGPDSHDRQVIQFRLRQCIGSHLEHGHRHRGGFEAHDHGRGDVRRQRLDDRLRNRRDLGLGAGEVGFRLQ